MTDAAFMSALEAEFSATAWANDVERKLPLHTDAETLKGDWSRGKARLHLADRARFVDLNTKVLERYRELVRARG